MVIKQFQVRLLLSSNFHFGVFTQNVYETLNPSLF